MPTKFTRDNARDRAKGFRWEQRQTTARTQQRSSPMMLLFLGIAFFAFLLLVSQLLLDATSNTDEALTAEGRVLEYRDESNQIEIEITDWPGPEPMEGGRFVAPAGALTRDTLREGAMVQLRYRYIRDGDAVDVLEVSHISTESEQANGDSG